MPVFEDVTVERGIHFQRYTGATGKYYMPETMGAGCAFLDYNGDGYPDILLLNGKDWTRKPGSRHTLALYKNDGKGYFTDVTQESGLEVELYAMGCAAADYNNDGDIDLCITCVDGIHLFENRHGHFTDVTRKAVSKARTGVRE